MKIAFYCRVDGQGFGFVHPKKLTSSASFSPSIRISLRLKIHQAQAKNFCRVLDIRVPEVVKPDVLRADGLQDLLMGVAEGVWVEHGAGLGRHEQVRTVWMLCVLLYQQLYRPLRDGQLADGIGRLGLADHQFTVDAVYLLADRDGHILHVQVRPQQGEELASPQAGGQLQIESRQQPASFCFGQIRADLVLR